MSSRTIMWAAAALLGIVATAALAWTASQLAGQRIGLSSEPLSVASGLAPASTPVPHRHKAARKPVVTAKPPSLLRSSPAQQGASRASIEPVPTTAAPVAPAPAVVTSPVSAPSTSPTTTVTPKAPATQQRDDSGGSGAGGGRSGSGSIGGGQRDD